MSTMRHHVHHSLSVDYVLASSAGVRWQRCLIRNVFPALQRAASASALFVEPRYPVATQARLSQQEYWQAFDDYFKDTDNYTSKLRASGIKPLTYRQQELRYVDRWIEPPLIMDKERCQPAAVLSFLCSLHPDDIRALLDGHLETKCTSHSSHCFFDGISSLRAKCIIDHIIPASRGGHNNRLNYFLMPRAVNNYFADKWTAEKVAYIGVNAALGPGSQYYGARFDHNRQRRCKLLHKQLH